MEKKKKKKRALGCSVHRTEDERSSGHVPAIDAGVASFLTVAKDLHFAQIHVC